MDELYPGDVVLISKEHKEWGICFLEPNSIRFNGDVRFLVLEVKEFRVRVVTLFNEESVRVGTFYRSWVQKETKFCQK